MLTVTDLKAAYGPVPVLTGVSLALGDGEIVVLFGRNGVGLFVNVTLMLGVVALSALAFPIGFFSALRTTVAQALPTYYTMVITRSIMLKGSEMSMFTEWYAATAGLIGLAAVALEGSIIYSRRRS